MGKVGKAEPKKEAAAEKGVDKAAEKEKAVEKAKQAAEDKAKEAEKEAHAKLLEEAQQKFADDERDEKARHELLKKNRESREAGAKLTGNRDKTLARVTRFQNRLKLFKGESEVDVVFKDIDGVDASKYVSELADLILEAAGNTVKLKELNSIVKVCSRLHATYEEFSALLSKSILKAFQTTPAGDLNRRRFLLRMCAELCLTECVVAQGCPLPAMVKELSDVSCSEEQVITNFTIIASLAQKHAPSCFNTLPAKQAAYAEILGKEWVVRKCVLDEASQAHLQKMVVTAFNASGSGMLTAAHQRLVDQEVVNAKLRVDKGQVDAENAQKHTDMKEALTKLQANLTTLSECLNQPMPTTQEEEDPGVSRLAGPVIKDDQEEEEILIYEDSEQQKFYEGVLDPKDVIPAVLLATGKAAVVEAVAGDGEKEKDKEEKPPEKPKDKKEEKEEKSDAKGGVASSDFDLYLARMSKAESAKQVDEAVIEFFHDFNSKGNRKQLAAHLFGVDKRKMHLLAPHSRFVATVAPYMAEVPKILMTWLQQELEQDMADKDPMSIEKKVKTVRYLCELCKFKVCPPGVILDAFKNFCDDFSQHNAELCAVILGCCGRYLLYTPETAQRADNLMDRMFRLKNSKNFPMRLEIMLEDSYYQVKPPEGKRQKAKEKEPLELFTQHLIFERLYREEDEDKLLKLVRKLPWESPSPAPEWLKKCLLDLNHHANYESLYQVASLLSGLAKYRDAFVIEVVDALFENIQVTIERNDFREMPLRVRQVKLLGELYNYRLVDSGLIFDSLYQFIGLGGPSIHKASHTMTAHKIVERASATRKGGLGSIQEDGDDEESGAQTLPLVLADPQHPLEAPWDFFRIKLVCVLLETCGHYFDRGAAKMKLDRFLHFFIRYVHSKGELPQRFMNMVYDCLERLRPKMAYPELKSEADEAVLKILKSERESFEGEKAATEDEEEGEESTDEDESGSDDDEESSEEESEDGDEESSSSSEEEENYKEYDRGNDDRQNRHAAEDDFDKEVQQMLIDSLEREKNRSGNVLAELPTPPTARKAESAAGPPVFSLLQKKAGGKTFTLKPIEVPEDSKLARARSDQVVEETKDKEDLKRFVMQSVESGAGVGGAGTVIPIAVRIRQGQGKGFQKGASSFHSRQRASRDYVQEDLMPEESKEEAPVSFGGGVVIRYASEKGKGKGSKGKGKGYDGKGGYSAPPAVGSGGVRRPRPPSEMHGTPSDVSRGSL